MDLTTHYRIALERISKLSEVTEARGHFEDLGFPQHLIKDGGWVAIDPRLKAGLRIAAKIAKEALDFSPP